MYIGVGIFLIAAGLLSAVFFNTTVGIILVVVGALAIVLSFLVAGRPGTKEVIVERERPVQREVVRERERDV